MPVFVYVFGVLVNKCRKVNSKIKLDKISQVKIKEIKRDKISQNKIR